MGRTHDCGPPRRMEFNPHIATISPAASTILVNRKIIRELDAPTLLRVSDSGKCCKYRPALAARQVVKPYSRALLRPVVFTIRYAAVRYPKLKTMPIRIVQVDA